MLKGRIHRARVTRLSIDYEGSIAIDRRLISLIKRAVKAMPF